MNRRHGLLALLATLCLAPVPGDGGGCGTGGEELAPGPFFRQRAALTCDRCQACSVRGARCEQACEGPLLNSFPEGCQPVEHDGQVCLRALAHASCAAIEDWLRDDAPLPSECRFCDPGDE